MRTVLLGLLGLALAVAVGLGVHALTRGTISLPVVRLEQPPPAPRSSTVSTDRVTVTQSRPTTGTEGAGGATEPLTEGELETGTTADDDSSGHGRGRGRSGGDSGGNSGSGGGDD